MSKSEAVASPSPTMGEDSQSLHDLVLRVAELEASRAALEQENKTLRLLLEKVIAHRQKSHGELVMLLTSLISKLPINDIGGIVSRLVDVLMNEAIQCVMDGNKPEEVDKAMRLCCNFPLGPLELCDLADATGAQPAYDAEVHLVEGDYLSLAPVFGRREVRLGWESESGLGRRRGRSSPCCRNPTSPSGRRGGGSPGICNRPRQCERARRPRRGLNYRCP